MAGYSNPQKPRLGMPGSAISAGYPIKHRVAIMRLINEIIYIYEWNAETNVAADININSNDNHSNSIYNEWNTKNDEAAHIDINNNDDQKNSIYNESTAPHESTDNIMNNSRQPKAAVNSINNDNDRSH